MKKGPCCHCGIEETPLWRSGPADKPVLCNACGSQWRLKRDLLNYTPKHGMNKSNGSHQSQDHIPPFPKRKRSSLQQPRPQSPEPRPESPPIVMSPMEEFHYQLYCLSQQPEFIKLHEEQERNILIYPNNSNRDPNEIGLRVVRLQPPPANK